MKKTVSSFHVSKKNIKQVQQKILDFYHHHKRDLPWRNTTNPYHILLSEIMLQQTQVPRVQQYYNRWIKQWPRIYDLAHAQRSILLKEWLGLGYNSRAVRLHQTARIICDQFDGDVLLAMHHYKHLPGIGQYTARAVRIFSANEDIITVDTNIRRILMYEFDLPQTVSDKVLWEIALACLPQGKSRQWHNALMDYGSLVLTSQKTQISPKTRQSRFQGSDRQIRASILRNVLNKPVSLSQLQEQITCEPQRLFSIIEQMQQEQLVTQKDNLLCIKEE